MKEHTHISLITYVLTYCLLLFNHCYTCHNKYNLDENLQNTVMYFTLRHQKIVFVTKNMLHGR
jgi:hypothetical protein